MTSPRRRGAGASALIHGLPGHPLHPPLTDATIGMFVLAAGLGVVGKADSLSGNAGPAMWLALIGGLIVAGPTAATGMADWLVLPWGSERWRTATRDLTAVASAVVLFALAAWRQHPGYPDGDVTTGGAAPGPAPLGVLPLRGRAPGRVGF